MAVKITTGSKKKTRRRVADKIYPMVTVMLGGGATAQRVMTDEEKTMWDFCEGEQWTPEQIAEMVAKPATGHINRISGFSIYKDEKL